MRLKIFFLCLFACSAAAIGQSNYAVLSGGVTDPQSQAVAGATVELTSASTGAIRRASTNDQGIYKSPGLQPGIRAADHGGRFAAIAIDEVKLPRSWP